MTTQLGIYAIGVIVVWLLAARLRSERARQLLYLIASYLFYASWATWFIVFLLFSSVVNYGWDRVGEMIRNRQQMAPSGMGTLLTAAVSERWVWIAPVVVVAALYLSLILQPGQMQTGPVMYALF
jgi:hypothetical protein